MSGKINRKKMSRKEFLSASAIAAGAGLLAACAPTPTPAPSAAPAVTPTPKPPTPTVAVTKAKLIMWAFPLIQDDMVLYRPIIEAFQKANPDIEVTVQIEPWSGRENKMLAAVAAGNPPDCVYLNPDFYPKFVATEAIIPLDKFLPAGIRDDYFQGALDSVTYNNQTYGLPILTSAFTQLYNVDLVQQAGVTTPPTTWDEFKAAVKKVNNPAQGIYGGFFDLKRPSPVSTFIPFLRMAGGDQFTKDGKDIAFDGPEGEEALDYLVSFFREELCQKANITGGGLPFSSGKIGYYIQCEPGWVKNVQKDAPNMKLAVTPCLKYKEQSNFGTVGSFAVFKLSKYHEAAAKWLAFLTNPENTLAICKASGFIVPRKSVPPEKYAEGVFKDIAAQAPLMRSEPRHIKSREVMAAQQPEFEAAYLGNKSVKDALKAAAEAARKILAS